MKKQKTVQFKDSVWKLAKRAADKLNTTRPRFIAQAIVNEAKRGAVK
ncbi:MAG: hypothetical protein PHE17_18005 [Thiothrix sp.]|nr:hypothetical protein [Thiothrix sp.]MDD5394915.1 hypothetical protein [Thiothrix sp.]